MPLAASAAPSGIIYGILLPRSTFPPGTGQEGQGTGVGVTHPAPSAASAAFCPDFWIKPLNQVIFFFPLLQSSRHAVLHRGLIPTMHPSTRGSSSPPGTAPPWPLSHLFPFPPSPPAPPGGLGGLRGSHSGSAGGNRRKKTRLSSAAPLLRSAAGSELSVGSCTTAVLQHPGTGG